MTSKMLEVKGWVYQQLATTTLEICTKLVTDTVYTPPIIRIIVTEWIESK